MAKFKVGDKVRVRSWESMVKQYGFNIGHSIATPGDAFVDSMRSYCGRVVTIDSIIEDVPGKGYSVYTIKGGISGTKPIWNFSDAMFESKPINNTIVIYRKDNQVIALDKSTGKTGIAYCSLEDIFDFSVGADLAFERLRGRKPAPKTREDAPKFYSGDIVCVKSMTSSFTKGKIYKVRDGKITNINNDDGCYRRFKSFDEINRLFASQFIELIK